MEKGVSGVTKKQANVLIGLVIVAILGAFMLYVKNEDRMAKLTGDHTRCWSSSCTVDMAMDAAERLERGSF